MTPTRAPRWAGRTVCVCATILLITACAGPGPEAEGDQALTAHLRISPTPPMAGQALVAVEAADAGAPAPPDTRVTVSVETQEGDVGQAYVLEAAGEGRWEGSVEFTRPGEVVTVVEVTLSGGRSAVFRFPVTVTRRPGS